MSIITLISDWGSTDYYSGCVKGSILSLDPTINIVDITHEIPKFNMRLAGFVLKNCFSSFPEGTIHIIAVETEEGKNADPDHISGDGDRNYTMSHIAVKYKGHYFIGTDNGIFDYMFGNANIEEAYDISIEQDSDSYTFSTRFRFVRAAVMIAHGTPISDLGKAHGPLRNFAFTRPAVKKDMIVGRVEYIDSYYNAITNISREQFEREHRGRRFEINIPNFIRPLTSISSGYKDVPEGEIVAIWGSHGFLEIAQNHGNFAHLNSIETDNQISIVFHDDSDTPAPAPTAAEGQLF